MTYGDAVLQFFYETVPAATPASAEVRFEAVSAEVFGTKQRRFGPMPAPEAQVAVRDVLRHNSGVVEFFTPWGASKQQERAGIDVLEFSALKQLLCLRESLRRYDVLGMFSFRLEDLTDRFLFGDARLKQIEDYCEDFAVLAQAVLPGSRLLPESLFTTWEAFRDAGESYAPAFYKVLTGRAEVESLREIGWAGDLPAAQRDYYYAAYRKLYPEADHARVLARYFAATLARTKLKATGRPLEPHVTVCFNHPIPGHPGKDARVFYRTIPERHTHQHKSPWMATGYLEVTAEGKCSPRFADPEGAGRLTPHEVTLAAGLRAVQVAAPYVEA